MLFFKNINDIKSKMTMTEDEDEDELCMYKGTIASRKEIKYLYRDEYALQKILDEEEEEDEEDHEEHICGETGGHESGGCGIKFNYNDGGMFYNTSFCMDCFEKKEDEEGEEEEEEDEEGEK